MFQFIDRPPSFGEKLARGLNQGAERALQEFQKMRERKATNEQFGEGIGNLPPELQKIYAQTFGKKKTPEELELEQSNYDRVKGALGEGVAELWKAAPTGGRTELLRSALEAKSRGMDLNKLFGEEGNEFNPTPSQSPGEIRKENKYPDVPDFRLPTQGYTPKEMNDLKSELRKTNTPIWKEHVDNLKSYHQMNRDINTLSQINERDKLPKGFGKLLINPETGAPYELVTAVKNMNPDVQLWVKTIARQATQAQTAFPGRVTNFDLQAYMRQFPSLFNTKDGRSLILSQLDLVNRANEIFSKNLDEVYKKYKLNGIPPEDAHELATQMSEGEITQIDNELARLAAEGENFSRQGEEIEEKARVDVIGPDGQLYDIDISEVELLPEGYRVK